MKKRRLPGVVQFLALNYIRNKPDKAYGSAIIAHVSKLLNRPNMAPAQIYMVLGSLEQKKLIVEAVTPEVTRKKPGRPHIHYRLTKKGEKIMDVLVP